MQWTSLTFLLVGFCRGFYWNILFQLTAVQACSSTKVHEKCHERWEAICWTQKAWASEAMGIVVICVNRSLWQYQMDSFSRQGTTSTVASFAVRCLLPRCPSWTTLLRQRAAHMWCPLWSQAFLRDLRSLRFEMRTFGLRLSMWLINWSRCHAWCLLQVSAVCVVRYLKAITAKVNKQNKGGMVQNLVLNKLVSTSTSCAGWLYGLFPEEIKPCPLGDHRESTCNLL